MYYENNCNGVSALLLIWIGLYLCEAGLLGLMLGRMETSCFCVVPVLVECRRKIEEFEYSFFFLDRLNNNYGEAIQ